VGGCTALAMVRDGNEALCKWTSAGGVPYMQGAPPRPGPDRAPVTGALSFPISIAAGGEASAGGDSGVVRGRQWVWASPGPCGWRSVAPHPAPRYAEQGDASWRTAGAQLAQARNQ